MPATRDAMITSHFRRLRNSAGVSVVYRRDGVDDIALTAIVGRSDFEVNQEDGFNRHLQIRDYIVEASALAIDGTQLEPREGDRLAEVDTEGEDIAVFEVQKPGEGEECWKYSDPARSWRRIHTKLVQAEALGA